MYFDLNPLISIRMEGTKNIDAILLALISD